jgi:hypothetical protein
VLQDGDDHNAGAIPQPGGLQREKQPLASLLPVRSQC